MFQPADRFEDDDAVDLIVELLAKKPGRRFCMEEAIRHPWIKKYAKELRIDYSTMIIKHEDKRHELAAAAAQADLANQAETA
ncbi:Protein kinase domain [Blastocladiella emersonii ATCC 22665]|nr:Protein kinase domain [Blastocladiella emersonii ATCC 22665]